MPYVLARLSRLALLSLAFAALTPDVASADAGLFLPSAPRGSGGQDSVESATGTRCSQSINNDGPYLDLGVAVNNNPDSSFRSTLGDDRDMEAVGYARIVIPLGPRPERIDCMRLYELELQRMRSEIEMLRMGLE